MGKNTNQDLYCRLFSHNLVCAGILEKRRDRCHLYTCPAVNFMII